MEVTRIWKFCECWFPFDLEDALCVRSSRWESCGDDSSFFRIEIDKEEDKSEYHSVTKSFAPECSKHIRSYKGVRE